MKKRLALAAGVATLAGMAHGQQLLGVRSSSPGQVFDVSTANGSTTFITDINGRNTSLIGAEWLNGRLYVSDVFGGQQFLGWVDLNTGNFTEVSDQDSDVNYHGLAGNESANILYSFSLNSAQLVEVDPGNGAVTYIGAPGQGFMRGMAYDNVNGVLWGANENGFISTINTGTGAITDIAVTGLDHGFIGLAHDDINGILYATAAIPGGGTFGLYTIDKATGVPTFVGDTGTTLLDGLAWVPAPSGLALLGLGGLVVSRRRR
ncbi:MAG: PEP-CTERM sorting domain-containing protein [Phycisphaeraceae bacterium]|nr:PEP-CTERM sorting domain-containing protein [Phycisphaeraceae bacterium]